MNNILTDKCKEEFESYLEKRMYSENAVVYGLSYFYLVPFSMQWGIYQDFFESVGIDLDTYVVYKGEDYKGYSFNMMYEKGLNNYDAQSFSNDRPEARKQAIIKANDLFNRN